MGLSKIIKFQNAGGPKIPSPVAVPMIRARACVLEKMN